MRDIRYSLSQGANLSAAECSSGVYPKSGVSWGARICNQGTWAPVIAAAANDVPHSLLLIPVRDWRFPSGWVSLAP